MDAKPEDKLDQPKKNPLWRALVVLVLIVAIGGLGVWRLSGRATKKVYIHTSCQFVDLPNGLSLSPSIHPQYIHVRGFEGSVSRIDVIVPKDSSLPKISTVSFASAPDPRVRALPTLMFQTEPPLGRIDLETKGKTSLSVTNPSDQETILQVSMRGSTSGTIMVQAGSLKFEEVRIRNPELNLANKAFTVSNTSQLVQLDLNSVPALVNDLPAAEFHYRPADANFPLMSVNDPPRLEGSLELDKCVNSDINVFGGDETQRSQSSQYRVDGTGLSIEDLSVIGPVSGGDKHPWISLQLSGQVSSITQNDNEMLPTMLEDILKRPAYEVGLWGALALLVISVGGVFLKRALDVISSKLIPDGKS